MSSIEALRFVFPGGLDELPVGTQLVRDGDRMQTYVVAEMDGWVAMMSTAGMFNIMDPPVWLFDMGPLAVVYEPGRVPPIHEVDWAPVTAALKEAVDQIEAGYKALGKAVRAVKP